MNIGCEFGFRIDDFESTIYRTVGAWERTTSCICTSPFQYYLEYVRHPIAQMINSNKYDKGGSDQLIGSNCDG